MGWALKSRKPAKRFTPAMLNWVKAYFMSGEHTGKKVTGEELSKLQRVAVDEEGKKLFMIEDYKTDVQLKGLLSRLTVLYKNDKSSFPTNIDVTSLPADIFVANNSEIPSYEDPYVELSAHATDLEGTPADLVVDDYVAFSDKDSCSWLPGTIVEVSKTHCKIKKMKRSTGSSFVWPENKTPVTVECKDILNFLEPPTFSHRLVIFKRRYSTIR